MATTISEIVVQFKADVAKALSAEIIRTICGYLGHTWRERILDPVTTVHVFLSSEFRGHQSSGDTILNS